MKHKKPKSNIDDEIFQTAKAIDAYRWYEWDENYRIFFESGHSISLSPKRLVGLYYGRAYYAKRGVDVQNLYKDIVAKRAGFLSQIRRIVERQFYREHEAQKVNAKKKKATR